MARGEGGGGWRGRGVEETLKGFKDFNLRAKALCAEFAGQSQSCGVMLNSTALCWGIVEAHVPKRARI